MFVKTTQFPMESVFSTQKYNMHRKIMSDAVSVQIMTGAGVSPRGEHYGPLRLSAPALWHPCCYFWSSPNSSPCDCSMVTVTSASERISRTSSACCSGLNETPLNLGFWFVMLASDCVSVPGD